MKKWIFAFLLVAGVLSSTHTVAQYESVVMEGEIGFSAGFAHYFGDLNTRARLNRMKPALGIFFRKQFNNYVALRLSGHYAQLGYSDIYNDNEFQKRRNLSFNTNIFELALQGDFNFFKFIPGDPDHRFTPYVTLGIGVFSYDPYAYYRDQKVFLRQLGTEGQGNAAYPDRKPYGSMAVCLPFGVGVKYAINERMNLGFEIAHRFTTTDYLDDVSKTYVGADKFPPLPDGQPSMAQLLQDRSYETGVPIGIEGRQRGLPNQKDQYIIAEVTFSFNLTSYRCPTAD
ncbi:MAG: outer membrane beta-barrel protein [Chitinophagaceae bacterium]|nr:outer membrane beta-barrel protein [Chitinophagaceae bacterium]